MNSEHPQWIYVASRAEPTIFGASFCPASGEIGSLQPAAPASSGFMALHPTKPILYAATREHARGSELNGGVRAYGIEGGGELTPAGFVSTRDNGTTHIAVAPDARCLLVCHYGGAGTTSIPLDDDGRLIDSPTLIAHQGSGAHPDRQTRPHPHGIAFSSCSQFAFVADLGNDHIEVFAVDGEGAISEHSHWQAAPGAGPRHVALHPSGRWLYGINELNSTIDVLHFDPAGPRLDRLQTISTLPPDFDGQSATAEIEVHPSGRFLYGSNRGHNSTVVFKIDEKDGRIEPVQFEPTRGDHPRFVGLDPTGMAFLSTNMESDNMFSFLVDQQTGMLTATDNRADVGKPMCVVFVPRERLG